MLIVLQKQHNQSHHIIIIKFLLHQEVHGVNNNNNYYYTYYTQHGIYDYNSALVKYVNSVHVCTVDQNDHSLLTTNAQVVLSLMQAELVKTDTSWSPLVSKHA